MHKFLIILSLFIFSCDEEEINTCTDVTDINCITGQWDYLNYTATELEINGCDGIGGEIDYDGHIESLESVFLNWNLEINSDGTMRYSEDSDYRDWTSNIDTLLIHSESQPSYRTMSFNNNNNFVLTSSNQAMFDEEGNFHCEYKWSAEFKKK